MGDFSRDDLRDIIRAELLTIQTKLADELRSEINSKINDIPSTIIRQSSKDGVKEAFALIGIDMSKTSDAVQWQQNFVYLDNLRRGSEKIKSKVTMTIIGILLGTFGYIFWDGIKEIIKSITNK